jgi:hypothetical protein
MLAATALEQYTTSGDVLRARIESLRLSPLPAQEADVNEGDTNAPTSAVTKTFAFPFQQANLQINSMLWNVFDTSGNFLYSEQKREPNALQLASGFTFREMRGYTLKIETQLISDSEIRTLANIDFELIGANPVEIPSSISPAFVDAYSSLADNYEQSYLRNIPLSRPKMLIISHASLAPYQTEFVKWKRSLGFEVYVVNKSDIGTTLTQIKAFIQTHYNQYKCDYLFLWGDVTGTFSIPTNFYPSPEYAENDADDQFYTLLAGDDYFPEMISGRFSFSNASEFITMANKTIVYEKAPYMSNPAWMSRALVVAGNYAEGNLRPSTPIAMSKWLRNKMFDYGYAEVDSVFFPDAYPGTSSILTSINQGVQFISYRGWGDANGWHYPSFHINNLVDTHNAAKMPIVYSIVCNTGDFANTQVNPCFGEAWMQAGTMASPGGCVAFVGPSDLHTKTRLNNSISSGAFRSILDRDVRGFGASVLAGKVELYKTFPNDLAIGQYVPFYFHVYNILSDPSLNMWVLQPSLISESVIEGGLTFAQSDSHIRINAANLEGAMVTGTKNGTDFLQASVIDGYAILPIDPNLEGNLTLTISKANFVPLVRELSPERSATIGIVSNSLANSIINPVSNYNIGLELKNFSATAYGATNVTLSSAHSGISITQPTLSLPALASGASGTLNFAFSTTTALHPNEVIDFSVSIDNPAELHLFQLKSGGAKIMVYSHEGIINPGQANQVTFNIGNPGNVAMSNVNIQVLALTTAAVAQSTPINIGALEPGQVKQFTATVTLPSDVATGRNLPFRFTATAENGYSYFCFYSATAGSPGTDDPTGPDEYGYFAYDSTDTAYPQAPVYNWVEIDPLLGGQANVFLNNDDGSLTVDLPFTFKYYGQDYNSVTLCTNGWISFVPTDMVDFYNCYIPAALGPYAMVAAYWDDLKGIKLGEDVEGNGIFDNMRVLYWYDAANNRYIIQWNNAYNQYTIDLMENASLEKFQIILYPKAGTDGDIVLQYHTIDNPGTTTNYCTIGIEDHTQMKGLTYTHGNTYPLTAAPLASGLAVKFTTTATDSYSANADLVNPLPITNLHNYPNPFNPTTTIAFTAKQAGKAKLSIYNVKGQLVKSLLNGELKAGEQKLVWDGSDSKGVLVGSGIYFYHLEMGDYRSINKMLLMK